MTGALQGKAVIVTGAGQGIGEATARLAGSLGALVIVNDLTDGPAEAVAASIRDHGGEAHAIAADISEWRAGEALVAACVERFGRLDGLVNNAGLFHLASLDDTTEQDLLAMWRVNVLGTATCAQAAARHMRDQGHGAIVNIVSGAQTGMLGLGAYGASKGAVASLTYSWALELSGTGVRLNAVSPLADTPMAHKTRAYLTAASIALPDSVPPPAANAPAICYLLSDRARGIHGQVFRVDGSVLALMTHPAVMEPVLTAEAWTVESVARAVDDQLRARQQELGIARVRCEPA